MTTTYNSCTDNFLLAKLFLYDRWLDQNSTEHCVTSCQHTNNDKERKDLRD